jgi:hypothetical protein
MKLKDMTVQDHKEWVKFSWWVTRNNSEYIAMLNRIEAEHGPMSLGEVVDKAFEAWKVDNV